MYTLKWLFYYGVTSKGVYPTVPGVILSLTRCGVAFRILRIMNNQETTSYHLEMLGQIVRNQLRIVEWAQGPGRSEVDSLLALLPDPVIEFQGELVLTGRLIVNHWDELDPLLTQLQHRVGSLYLDSDEPELRIRVYKASGHPYLTTKLRVTVPVSSQELEVGTRQHDNPLWEYFWMDHKRER